MFRRGYVCNTVWGQKKRKMLCCSRFLNFWDMKTLIPSKDRIFDSFWDNFQNETTFSWPTNGTKPKITKKICSFFYPWAFFVQVYYVPHIILTSKLLFRASFANSCHFELYSCRIRSFPAILSKPEKWSFLAKKSMFFSWKSKFSVLELTDKNDWRVPNEKCIQKYF